MSLDTTLLMKLSCTSVEPIFLCKLLFSCFHTNEFSSCHITRICLQKLLIGGTCSQKNGASWQHFQQNVKHLKQNNLKHLRKFHGFQVLWAPNTYRNQASFKKCFLVTPILRFTIRLFIIESLYSFQGVSYCLWWSIMKLQIRKKRSHVMEHYRILNLDR